MINKLYKAVVVLSMFAAAGTASAVPISGSIGFTGSYDIRDSSNSVVTGFNSGESVHILTANVTGSVTGSFAAEGITSSSLVAYSDVTYSPASAIANLWSVGSFTFDLGIMNVDFMNDSVLVLSGSGIISSTDAGLDDSFGGWAFTANSAGSNFTWSSSSTSSAVPAPPVVYLLGLGILGLIGMARCKKA